jgi:large subunit ribosomal protein L44e
MKIVKETNTFCPKCNKHTPHVVNIYSKKPELTFNMGKRRRERKLQGYVGKVKGQAKVKKVSKKQKVILECKECKYSVERVIGTRTKKKLEIKR